MCAYPVRVRSERVTYFLLTVSMWRIKSIELGAAAYRNNHLAFSDSVCYRAVTIWFLVAMENNYCKPI